MTITESTHISVSEMNFRIKALLESSGPLRDVWVKGEISNLKHYSKGGQIYFNLSDEQATINCVLYASALSYMSFVPKNNQAVFVRGKAILFQKRGQLMFQVAYMTEDGIGEEAKKLEALYKQLSDEGLFEQKHKKAIPEFPERIGIITSPDSAAMWDFVTTYKQYASYSKLMIIPAVMQGAQSALSVIEALDFASTEQLDLIVIIRGGGSSQDLASFNDENLVRALFRCPVPSITGLGHEVDSSLLDLVADQSCATPTACAEFVIKAVLELKQFIRLSLQKYESQIGYKLDKELCHIENSLQQADQAVSKRLQQARAELELLNKKCFYLNPFNPIKRGYAYIEKEGQKLRSVKSLSEGDTINSNFIDGSVTSVVSGIQYEQRNQCI